MKNYGIEYLLILFVFANVLAEDFTRITSASCLGALLKWMPASELESNMAVILTGAWLDL
jgi:hypothetical protein